MKKLFQNSPEWDWKHQLIKVLKNFALQLVYLEYKTSQKSAEYQ